MTEENAGKGDHSRLMYSTKVTSAEFQGWPKTPRLLKDMTVTEKIDGTNACVVIIPQPIDHTIIPELHRISVVMGGESTDVESVYKVYAQSRNRMITPESDNYGFARWVQENAEELVSVLGPGRHYGEWWGRGIQRNYGMDRRMFSLFNTDKWSQLDPVYEDQLGLSVVPELYRGPFDSVKVEKIMRELREEGSAAAPGWDGEPEGVCVFHHASRQVFKVTLEHDGPKGLHDNNVVPLFRDVSGFSGQASAA